MFKMFFLTMKVHCMGKKTNIFQNIFFFVTQNKESHRLVNNIRVSELSFLGKWPFQLCKGWVAEKTYSK